jgi:hypothetical protein
MRSPFNYRSADARFLQKPFRFCALLESLGQPQIRKSPASTACASRRSFLAAALTFPLAQ